MKNFFDNLISTAYQASGKKAGELTNEDKIALAFIFGLELELTKNNRLFIKEKIAFIDSDQGLRIIYKRDD